MRTKYENARVLRFRCTLVVKVNPLSRTMACRIIDNIVVLSCKAPEFYLI